MCAHPDHKVVTLPDGQVDETHVFAAAEFVLLQSRINDVVHRMHLAAYAHGYPQEVS